MRKKVLALLLSLGLLTTGVFGEDYLEQPGNQTGAEGEGEESLPATPFLDLEGHWAEEVVGIMTGLGLFTGKTETSFAPDDIMTRAEFITVVIRSIYPTVEYMTSTPYWYSGYYATAEAEGFLPITFREKYMTEAITRQEMAYVVATALEKQGEVPENWLTAKSIPDFKQVGTAYETAVLFAYSQGIIGGVDEAGTFDPYADATRGECAVVLLNMVDASYRQEVIFPVDPNAMTDMNRLDISYTKSRSVLSYEAGDTERPVAKVGDTISGKTVVAHPTGAVANGMAVPYLSAGNALDLGINTNSNYGAVAHGFTGGGIHYGGDTYYVNPQTKEGYWESQWLAICNLVAKPGAVGTKDGQVSTDAYKLYTWSTEEHSWLPSYLF